ISSHVASFPQSSLLSDEAGGKHGPRNSACRARGDIYNGLRPFRIQGPNMARVIPIGLAAACAVSLAGCNFIRDDINRSLGRSPADHTRQADIAASQVTTIGVNAY